VSAGRHRRPVVYSGRRRRAEVGRFRWFARGATVLALAFFYTGVGALSPVEATP
jgi:hypothetical protein